MTVPLVGVTTYSAEASWGPWQRSAAVVPSSYVEMVAGAGGRPVLLPPCRTAPAGPKAGAHEVAGALDALVLVGGGDVDPARYGHAPEPAVGGVDPIRDHSEAALLAAALERDLPVLAICRGHQLLNVHLGGTLVQHMVGHQPGPGRFDKIQVTTEPGTRVAAALGPITTVACSHHQAIDRIAPGLTVTARSGDQVIEAVEMESRRFVVGVQWHPEETGDDRLFTALIGAAG